MAKMARMRFASAASALFIALASPASAGVELVPASYDAAITTAKKSMVADPAKALDFARSAKGLVGGNGIDAASKDRLIADWLEAEALMRLNRPKEAVAIIKPALDEAARSYRDDKIFADLLRSSASIKARTGSPAMALEHFAMAKERYEQLGDARSCAIVLQNIGSLYSRARDFERVLEFYKEAAEIYSDDAILSLSAHNNIGNALKGLERFEEAEKHFDKALVIADRMQSPLLKARILTNLASTQHVAGRSGIAEATANQALLLAEEHAPDWTRFVHGVLAQVELEKGNLDLADAHLKLTFEGKGPETTDEMYREFHEAAALLFAKRGEDQLASLHEAAVTRIDNGALNLSVS